MRHQLPGLDGKDYAAYQSLRGEHVFPEFTLFIDQIPKDPYAPPSTGIYRARVDCESAGFKGDMSHPKVRRIALEDYLARHFFRNCESVSRGRRGTGNSGIITIAEPGQTILERSSIFVAGEYVEARFFIGLPASGRDINADLAATMLFEELPEIVTRSLFLQSLEHDAIYRHLETAEDSQYLRDSLLGSNLVAFVADGAILPRRSGIDERPLPRDEAVVFRSPDSLRVRFELPNRGEVTGMGIAAGITLIVGGGFHGKSTLLNAIEQGIYDHVPGDGRELCVSSPDAVKVRAASGRAVTAVDISPFLDNLPHGQDTTSFSTANASGSTSQAASIIEAIEMGAGVLLMDEDTCATNFMIRDKRMQELVARSDEPITSFIDCVRALHDTEGISTVLVMGGSGDYFELADLVIQMKEYLPGDVTAKAHDLAAAYPTGRVEEMTGSFTGLPARAPRGEGLDPYNEYQRVRIAAAGRNSLIFGQDETDLGDVEQLVESAQTKAIGLAILHARERMDGNRPLKEIVQAVGGSIDSGGIDILDGNLTGDIAAFRPYELAAALNRMRGLRIGERTC